MIDKIRKFFEANLELNSDAADTQEKQIELACITLLIELAKVDQSIDEDEISVIRGVATSLFDISDSKLDEIILLAIEESKQSTSLYQFTDLVNSNYSDDMKYQLVFSLWRVAFADGQLDKYEEHLIRKIAELTYVPHVKFMEAKFRAQQVSAKR